jgi:hypothetical protein
MWMENVIEVEENFQAGNPIGSDVKLKLVENEANNEIENGWHDL